MAEAVTCPNCSTAYVPVSQERYDELEAKYLMDVEPGARMTVMATDPTLGPLPLVTPPHACPGCGNEP